MQKPTNPTASNTTAVHKTNEIESWTILTKNANYGRSSLTYYYGPRRPRRHFGAVGRAQRIGRGRDERYGRRSRVFVRQFGFCANNKYHRFERTESV